MKKRFIALGKFLIANEEFPEPIEPGMGHLHNPPTVLGWTPASPVLACHPRGIAPGSYLLVGGISVIPLIRIQPPLLPSGEGDDHGIEHGGELADVMSIRPGNDQRQRDATTVHQDMPLASLFFPDPWGSGRRLPVPEAL